MRTMWQQFLARLRCTLTMHEWSEWVEIGGGEYDAGPVHVRIVPRRIPVTAATNRCLRCGVPITEAEGWR